MAAAGAVARLVYYAATCAAVPMLRLKRGLMPDASQLPWGAIIPMLGLLASLFIIAGADTNFLMLRAIALLVGAGFYGVQSFRRRKDR
jgi:amino acid transporter